MVSIVKDESYYLSKERFVYDESSKRTIKYVQVPLSEFKAFESSFEVRCPYLYRIRTEDNRIAPFLFNEAQKVLHDAIEEDFARSIAQVGNPRSEIITLKPRQFGATTYTAIRNLDFMLNLKECRGLVLNHTGDDTVLVYDKYQTAYDNLPDYIEFVSDKGEVLSTINFKPNAKSYSANELRFSDATKAWMIVRTAGSGDNVGKGGTINLFHTTESANYQHYEKVMSSAKNQMTTNNTVKFVMNETTANGTTGIGEGYYKGWMKAVSSWDKFVKNGKKGSYDEPRPVFVKWYLLKKYRLPLEDGQLEDISDIDFGSEETKRQFLERERILMEKENVPIEAINWYRQNIKARCNYNYSEACRYFPTFPEDAFLASNNCFFDSAKLYELKTQYENREIVDDYARGYLNEELDFVPSQFGELTIKEEPEFTHANRYIVSCDQSEGLAEGDYTSMKVFDRLTRRFVAHWFGKAAEDIVAYEFKKLGLYYNEAYLVPERNRATVLNIIKPDGVEPYEGEIFVDEYRSGGDPVFGVMTTSHTRKLLLDERYAELRDMGYDHSIYDEQTLDQHIHFIRNVTSRGSVRYEAAQGKSDDIVFADALCIYAANRIEDEIIEMNADKTDIERFLDAPRLKRQSKKRAQTMLGKKPSVQMFTVGMK